MSNEILTPTCDTTSEMQYLIFEINAQKMALKILSIKEIIECGRVTTVPMMLDFLIGVINLRGAVVPVVDVRMKLGQGLSSISRRSCIVIVEVKLGEENRVVGFLVDSVNSVVDIPDSLISAAPKMGSNVRSEFLGGIGKVDTQFVMILDPSKLIVTDSPLPEDCTVPAPSALELQD